MGLHTCRAIHKVRPYSSPIAEATNYYMSPLLPDTCGKLVVYTYEDHSYCRGEALFVIIPLLNTF